MAASARRRTSPRCRLQIATGLAFTQAGYRGGGPQVTGLVAGDVPYGLVAISSSIGHVQGGRLRALAVTSAARSPLLPEVPTTAEAGLPAMDLVGWWGFITPAGLRPEVQERLHALLLAPAREPAVRARLEGLGYSVVASGPAEFAGADPARGGAVDRGGEPAGVARGIARALAP